MPDKPQPYNRFAGNPPAGETPEQAYEKETGKSPVEDSDAERIKKLEAENKELREQVEKSQHSTKHPTEKHAK